MTELVHYAVDRAIATVVLDSPDNRNALSAQLVGELSAHLQTAAADSAVRAVVLTHTGSTFCAGADLKEAAAEGGPERGTQRMVALLRLIVEVPKPVIARIDGNVRAGGLGIVGACDIAVAGPTSSFAFTEVRLGLAPAIISLTTHGPDDPARGGPLLPDRRAVRRLDCGSGWSDHCGGERSGRRDRAHADELRACSPQGLAETKPLTTMGVLADFDGRAKEMQAVSARLFGSAEARAGMTAFLQRRPPPWAPPG